MHACDSIVVLSDISLLLCLDLVVIDMAMWRIRR